MKTIMVKDRTHKELMLFKIRCKVKNLDKLIKMAIRALRDMQVK